MPTPSNDALDRCLDELYNLDRTELRRLAWEALLISDGPNKIEGPAPFGFDSVHRVHYGSYGSWKRFELWYYGEES